LQKELRDLHALLSKPVTRAAVHPIRAPRHASSSRQATPKLFDIPQNSEGSD